MAKMILTTIFLRENIDKNVTLENEELMKRASQESKKRYYWCRYIWEAFEGVVFYKNTQSILCGV